MPPILVKTYQWTQTDVKLTITLPIKGAGKDKTDIFTYSNYIKVHYAPYIFEAFLLNRIDDSQSQCNFTESTIILDLIKKDSGIWPSLLKSLTKDEQTALRNEIISQKHQYENEQSQKKRELRGQLRRCAVQEAINLDTKNKEIVDGLKNEIRNVVTKDIEKTICVTNHEISTSEDYYQIPLPREGGEIIIKFSKRDFPTPCRESQTPLEQEWLQKQLEARKAIGFVAEDLRPEECSPQWLLNKGNSFLKVGNYLGAISAYSHAVKIGSKLPDFYKNRAMAHKAIENYRKALDDYTTALELLTPCVKDNAIERAECHWGRGWVLGKLNLHESSLSDYVEAMKILSNDKTLRAEYDCLVNSL